MASDYSILSNVFVCLSIKSVPWIQRLDTIDSALKSLGALYRFLYCLRKVVSMIFDCLNIFEVYDLVILVLSFIPFFISIDISYLMALLKKICKEGGRRRWGAVLGAWNYVSCFNSKTQCKTLELRLVPDVFWGKS